MAEPFIGEIKMFAGNFAPRGWATCDGQLLAIAQNTALFALLGTTYGGDGRTTFGLPDLRGRLPLHAGNGPGLTSRTQGARSGSELVSINANQMPGHGHTPRCTNQPGTTASPEGAIWAGVSHGTAYTDGPVTTTANANANAIGSTGGAQAHPNLMPYLCVTFIIALVGIFPSRN
jgi:microcystin-dependent protein